MKYIAFYILLRISNINKYKMVYNKVISNFYFFFWLKMGKMYLDSYLWEFFKKSILKRSCNPTILGENYNEILHAFLLSYIIHLDVAVMLFYGTFKNDRFHFLKGYFRGAQNVVHIL